MDELSSSAKSISTAKKKAVKMENKKQLKPLQNSGLVNTLSITGTSNPVNKGVNEKVLGSCISLKESFLGKKLKASILSDCKFEPLFSTESILRDSKAATSRPLPDPNKVNELDCLNNRNQSRPYPLCKTFFHQLLKSQFKFTSRRTPRKTFKEKSPSTGPPKSKRKTKKSLSDSEDEVMSHVKSIANCLLENTLNKLDIKESSKLIADYIDDPTVKTPPNDSACSSNSNFEVLDTPTTSTSQGKNSCNNLEPSKQNGVLDIINENINKVNDINAHSNVIENQNALQHNIEKQKDTKVSNDVARASREALFDPNSQVDLLEDFDIPPFLHEFESVQTVSLNASPNAVVLVGINRLNNNESAPPIAGVFPEWLLQMLRTNFPTDTEITHDGPHFYCQGDGLGVHPSTMVIDVDENEDASSESSSTNGSATLAEAEDSSVQDVISLPDDNEGLLVRGRSFQSSNSLWDVNSNGTTSQWPVQNEESEEYFDTTDQVGTISGKLTD